MADGLLVGITVLPVLITYFLKSNAALSFLALCAGFVLSTSVIGDLKHLLSQTNLSVTNDTLAVILIAGPFLLTLLLTTKSVGRGLFLILQLAAALAGGGLLALSIGPLLSSSGQFNVTSSGFWPDLTKIQAGIIGVGALISLVLVWLSGGKHRKKH